MAKEPRPQTQARQNAVKLIEAAQEYGLSISHIEIDADGRAAIFFTKPEHLGGDDFLNGDLRMGS